MHDLDAGVLGSVTPYMVAELHVNGLQFQRLGCMGDGRCLLATFYSSMGVTYSDLSVQQRREQYDIHRAVLHAQWLLMGTPENAAAKAKYQAMLFDVGNSGADYDELQPPEHRLLACNAPARVEYRQNVVWNKLGQHLSAPDMSLGWDTLAWLATEHKVNVILYVHYTERVVLGQGTRAAKERWAKAKKDRQVAAAKKRMRPYDPMPGSWCETNRATSTRVIPARLVPSWPIIVLFQRTEADRETWVEHSTDKNGKVWDTEEAKVTGGKGHYESVVLKDNSAPTAPTGFFQAEHAPTEKAHQHLVAIAQRYLAGKASAAASAAMAVQYDKKARIHRFNLFDAVAVRVAGFKPRSGAVAGSLPGVIVGIVDREAGSGKTRVSHQLYTVWCPHGVLSDAFPVDRLTSLSINLFEELKSFRDSTLTTAERLPPTDSGWSSPLTGTAAAYPKISVVNAWKAHNKKFKQAAVDQSRKRTTEARVSAVAADRLNAFALSAISNQPAPVLSQNSVGSSGRTRGSHIVQILYQSGSRYFVQYSEPEGNPETGWVGVKRMDTQAEYMEIVLAFRVLRRRVQR